MHTVAGELQTMVGQLSVLMDLILQLLALSSVDKASDALEHIAAAMTKTNATHDLLVDEVSVRKSAWRRAP